MSTDNERGSLGGRFHDLPTPADNPDLSWEKMAPHILQPTEPEQEPKDRVVAWWWFALGALVLLIGAGWYELSQPQVDPASPMEQTVAVSDPVTGVSASANGSSEDLSYPVGSAPVGERLFSSPITRQTNELVPHSTATEQANDRLDSPVQKFIASQQPVIDELADQPVVPAAVEKLPNQLITTIPFAKHHLNTEVVTEKPFTKAGNTKAWSLLAGPLSYNLGYDDPTATTQLSGQLRLGYEQVLNDRWFVATGIELRHHRLQSAFESIDENARIYQPGTVDTIFRNLTTGVETTSTTDTVGGVRTRRFVNDNVVNTVGLPLLIGYYQTFAHHRLSLAAGPRVDILLNRQGKIATNDLEVVDFTEAPGFGQNLRWGGRLEAGYDWQSKGRWSLSIRAGAQTALSDWSTDGSGQRPTSFDGMIGLRYRW